MHTEFQQSCLRYDSYPLNLIVNGTRDYHSTLQSYKKRLDAKRHNLCLSTEKFANVPIREIHEGLDTLNAQSNFIELDDFRLQTLGHLNQWLGIGAKKEPSPLLRSITTRKTAPKCRFMQVLPCLSLAAIDYFNQIHIWSKLKIRTSNNLRYARSDSYISPSDARIPGFHVRFWSPK